MNELFKTVLILSMFGFIITAVLLALKPVTDKKFPAKWQYYVWVCVLLSMLIPIYKFIPEKEVQNLPFVSQSEPEILQIPNQNTAPTENTAPAQTFSSVTENIQQNIEEKQDILSLIWITGAIVFSLVIFISYTIYLIRKRKNSFFITDNIVFENVKKELNIKRNIKLKMCCDIGSPMLVGLFFPVVYIPAKNIGDEKLRMVFLHELTHYKRHDLFIKWLALFVNAVHWFNPLSYILCANLSESCEISCDMQVTHNMQDDEQKLYMQTILDLAS